MAVAKNTKKSPAKKVAVIPSSNIELNALVGIKAKVEFLSINWFAQHFNEEFGELNQTNMAKCIGCSIQSVAVYWDAEAIQKLIQAWKVEQAKTINQASRTTPTTSNSILDDEPVRSNKIVTYTTENSTKSLKELYFELGEAHGELEAVESKIEFLETEIQQKRLK